MRPPYATILISLLLISAYFYLSNFTLYSTEKDLLNLSYHISKSPALVIIYMFVHTGVFHLFGNLVPLILFSVILESKAGSKNTFLIFILSGISAAILFSIFEPKYALIGASAAVAGIMGAATTRSPKSAFLLLFLTPILIYYLIFPSIAYVTLSIQSNLRQETINLNSQISNAIKSGDIQKADFLNKSLTNVVAESQKIDSGKRFELETPTSILVHLFGAVFGVIYLYILNKTEFLNGLIEYKKITSKL